MLIVLVDPSQVNFQDVLNVRTRMEVKPSIVRVRREYWGQAPPLKLYSITHKEGMEFSTVEELDEYLINALEKHVEGDINGEDSTKII